MGKYRDDAEKLLEYVGGKENIAAVTHCATRMRFVLNDQSKANEKAIEEIPMRDNSKSLSAMMSQRFTMILPMYQE